MADVKLHQAEAFNDLHFEVTEKRQAVDISKSTGTHITDEESVFTAMNNYTSSTHDLHMNSSSELPITTRPEHLLANGYTNKDDPVMHDLENEKYENGLSHAGKGHASLLDEELLCAGETLDAAAVIPTNNTLADVKEKSKEDTTTDDVAEVQGSMSWADKKRQFGLMKEQSGNSISSEVSSQSRHSMSSYLYARECDAEEVLLKLGFGLDRSMDIPERFWSDTPNTNTNSVIPRDMSMEEDEVFDCACSSMASLESSWSDSSVERLPSRFTSSLSRSSLSSVSESNDTEDQSVIPSIIEPENPDEGDSFDLMRHLRLNRHTDKGFLEPVKEEPEVSSVGSGSARTKVDAQQDSFDSLGTVSVATKIWLKGESEDSTTRTLRSGSIPEVPENTSFEHSDSKEEIIVDKDEGILNNNEKSENLSKDESQIMAKKNLILPQHKRLQIGLPQDSFELEEIATSEENLDRIEEQRTATETNRANNLKRENSDESSGFEDDSADFLKRASPENHSLSSDSLKEKPSDNEKQIPDKDQKTYLLVPCQSSTPNQDAETRRSAFAKRHTWSTTKQKRVVFEDETYQRSWSFGDLPTATRKLDVKSRSLDSCLPPSSKTLVENATTSLKKAEKQGGTLTISASPSVSDTKRRSSSKTIAVNNIKMFISSLLSVRRRFKNPVIPKLDSLRQVDKSEGQSTERHSDVCTTVKQKEVTRLPPSLVIHDTELQLSQKLCRKELKTFEENLQKYHSTFLAMDVISTSQDKYHTRKLQARFAWDILFIRRLRSEIKDELDVMRSNLLSRTEVHATPLPRGVQEQMESLLRLQAGLRENLLTLAKNSPDFYWRVKPVKTTNYTTFDMSNLMKDAEKKIRDSVIQELGSVFQLQIDELRAEMKGKDAIINNLLKRLQKHE